MKGRSGLAPRNWGGVTLVAALGAFVALAGPIPLLRGQGRAGGHLPTLSEQGMPPPQPCGQVLGQRGAASVPDKRCLTPRPSFASATVKLSATGGPLQSNMPLDNSASMPDVGAVFSAKNVDLLTLIAFAYKPSYDVRIVTAGIPDWAGSARFDIEAKAKGTPHKDDFRLMVQSLLAERFKMAFHFQSRGVPVFVLAPATPGAMGPHLTPHVDDGTCESAGPPTSDLRLDSLPCDGLRTAFLTPYGVERMAGRDVTIGLLILALKDNFDRPLLDHTGLEGSFDAEMEWSPKPATAPPGFQADPEAPTLEQALEKDLGIRVEPQTTQLDVLVVDHIQKP